MGNDSLWVWQVATPTTMRGQETTNDIELGRTRFEVVIVDQGYRVSCLHGGLEAAVGQILLCEWEGGNIHDSYAVTVVENNDTPIDNNTLLLYENIRR